MFLLILGAVYANPTIPAQALGIGVIADSCCDEYRADDNRGGAFGATTLNWVELFAKYRNWDLGRWGVWGGPRRSGYEYNWSRSGATTFDMISNGQHTGLANQALAGKVQLALIFIGSNDFAPYRSDGYSPIYTGTLSGSALQIKLDAVANNIKQAADTLRNAGVQRVAVAGIPDWGMSPNVVRSFPNATGRQRVTAAVANVNNQIKNYLALHQQSVYIDSDLLAQSLLGGGAANGKLIVGGVEINLLTNGDDPHNFLLADGIHAGTVAEGLTANFIAGYLNTAWGLNIRLFTEEEILVAAGLGADSLICKSDINQDGLVDIEDYGALVRDLLTTANPLNRTDINGDGFVDIQDYNILSARFLTSCL